MLVIPRAEHLPLIQRVHAKFSEVYDDRDDAEANETFFKMLAEAEAGAEEVYKDRPANS